MMPIEKWRFNGRVGAGSAGCEQRESSDEPLLPPDANELVREIRADLVYIDPPYNSRQYCDIYHLLENVARWERPEVSGVARKMPRDELKKATTVPKGRAGV